MMEIGLLTRVTAITLGLFLMAGTGAALASTDQQLYVGSQKVELNQSLWNVDGWSYVPVREFSERMGWKLSYDRDSGNIAIENSIGDILSFKTGMSKVAYNGSTYEISGSIRVKNGNAYFPLRSLAEAMHASVGWRAEERMAVVETKPEYIVGDGDSLSSVAQFYQTTAEALRLRNGLTDETLQSGQRLKVVIPGFLDPSRKAAAPSAEMKAAAEPVAEVDQADLMLLAKLVETEAGNEPYAGKLAVANVVMNRVMDSDYPDTVKGVIYAPHQFSPAGNGLLAKTTASKDSVKAAKAALSGENNVPGAVYFFNPKLEPGKLKKVTVVKEIGHHVFAK